MPALSLELKILPLDASTLAAAADLHAHAFAASAERGWSARELQQLLASSGAHGFFAASDTRICGFVLWRVVADEAELLTIAVTPDLRRRGIASLLLQKAVTSAAEGGGNSLFLEVAEDNVAALRLYAQAGFAPIGRRSRYYRRGTGQHADAVVMRRALTELDKSGDARPSG
jgi:ribosomal-protein-alanine N-acetyltransferase